jgi:hypothetical protein
MVHNKENNMDATTALKIIDGYESSLTVAQIYNDDDQFADALLSLFPHFEYPDFSHLTVKQVLGQYGRLAK